MPTPFEALGLSDDATVTQVRAAWRLKVAVPGVHPDMGGNLTAFVALRDAYERALRIARDAPCGACNGSGKIGVGQGSFVKTLMRCPTCGGRGSRDI